MTRGTKVSGFFFFFNVNEVTFGSLIGHLRMKAGCRGKAHVIGELGGRAEGRRDGGWMNQCPVI